MQFLLFSILHTIIENKIKINYGGADANRRCLRKIENGILFSLVCWGRSGTFIRRRWKAPWALHKGCAARLSRASPTMCCIQRLGRHTSPCRRRINSVVQGATWSCPPAFHRTNETVPLFDPCPSQSTRKYYHLHGKRKLEITENLRF